MVRLLRHLRVDDVVSAVPIHLVSGAVSVLAPGFFASADNLMHLAKQPSRLAATRSAGVFFGGDGRQLAVQLLWLSFILLWTVVITVPLCLGLRSMGIL